MPSSPLLCERGTLAVGASTPSCVCVWVGGCVGISLPVNQELHPPPFPRKAIPHRTTPPPSSSLHFRQTPLVKKRAGGSLTRVPALILSGFLRVGVRICVSCFSSGSALYVYTCVCVCVCVLVRGLVSVGLVCQ